MKVFLNVIPSSSLTLSEELDPAGMNLQTPEVIFLSPVHVAAVFEKERNAVIVKVEARGTQQCICGRCSEAYSKDYKEHFSFGFAVKNEEFLDVTDDIRQEILLSYPVRCICSEECLGLCLSCGKNLNSGPCSCHEVNHATS